MPAPEKKQSRNQSSGNTTVNSEKYTPSQTNSNSSMLRVGKNIMEGDQSLYDTPVKA